MKRSLAVVLAAVACAVASSPAQGAVTLDQQQTFWDNFSGIDGPQSGAGFSVAQSFTPGLTGFLDQVDVYLHRYESASGPLTVEIRDVDGTGLPGSTVLASASVAAADVPVFPPSPGAFVPVALGSQPLVRAGSRYAIVAYAGGADHYGIAMTYSGNPYPSGAALFSRASPPAAWGLFSAGDADTAFKTYVSTYDFAGFSSPVDNPPVVNVAKAGSSIPIKFGLGADEGLDVLLEGSPTVTLATCDGSPPEDVIEQTTTANHGLTYDAVSNTYNYVWKTDKSWSGQCATFTLALADGSVHTAEFQLR